MEMKFHCFVLEKKLMEKWVAKGEELGKGINIGIIRSMLIYFFLV